MDFTTFGFLDGLQIPLPVTLACACVCSYLIGQLPLAKQKAAAAKTSTADTDRVRRLLDRLDHEIDSFREDLVAHETSLEEFKQGRLTEDQDEPSPDQFTEDARRALRAMQRLANEIPQAFHSIERTTTSAVDALKTEFHQLAEDCSQETAAAAELAAEGQPAHRREFANSTDHT